MNLPEITQAVVNSGSVSVAFASPVLPEAWTAIPFVSALSSGTITLIYSVDVGKVVVRLHASTNEDIGPLPVPFKVTVVP